MIRDINPGGTILLHSGLQTTIDSLGSTVTELRNRGYAFTTVSEMVIDGGTTQRSGRALLSKTRVDDTSDDIGTLFGGNEPIEDYALKLREYKLDNPVTKVQRMLNRARATH
jgi:hypothetical protein